MGLNFRRRLRLLPGLWLNLSRSAISVSIGGKGFTFNRGPNGTRSTVSLPSTGLSYTTRRRTANPVASDEPANASKKNRPWVRLIAWALWIFLILYLTAVMRK
jgi:hypothetical protein